MLLEPRSLLCFSGGAYTDLLHGIDAAEEDQIGPECCNATVPTVVQRGMRLSITLRRAVCSDAMEVFVCVYVCVYLLCV